MFVRYLRWSTVASIWTLTGLLLYTYPINIESIKLQVFKGWYANITSGSDTVLTVLKCASLSAERMKSSTAYPLTTYNKTTLECNIATNIPPHIVMHYSGDEEDMVLWDEKDCSLTDGVFKKIDDTDLRGYDSAYQGGVTIEACITFCATTIPNHHGIMHSDTGRCYCKSVTKQEYLDAGKILHYFAGWTYYERLC